MILWCYCKLVMTWYYWNDEVTIEYWWWPVLMMTVVVLVYWWYSDYYYYSWPSIVSLLVLTMLLFMYCWYIWYCGIVDDYCCYWMAVLNDDIPWWSDGWRWWSMIGWCCVGIYCCDRPISDNVSIIIIEMTDVCDNDNVCIGIINVNYYVSENWYWSSSSNYY